MKPPLACVPSSGVSSSINIHVEYTHCFAQLTFVPPLCVERGLKLAWVGTSMGRHSRAYALGCSAADVHERVRGAAVGGGDGDGLPAAHHERPSVHRVGHPGQRWGSGAVTWPYSASGALRSADCFVLPPARPLLSKFAFSTPVLMRVGVFCLRSWSVPDGFLLVAGGTYGFLSRVAPQ